VNARGLLYLAALRLRGSTIPVHRARYLEADRRGADEGTSRDLLHRLLRHCRERVPYYARLLPDAAAVDRDPVAALGSMPLLQKSDVRDHFESLQSRDLASRRWHLNTSGGSTGEPIRLVQDAEYDDRTGGLTLAYTHWIGHDPGEPQVLLWGSERDVLERTVGWRARASNFLSATTFLNAFMMTPSAMREFAVKLRRVRPRLVVAYAQALYELTGFLEREGLEVPPPRAAVTSAGTLHRFMRERIERVLRCPVFDRYGSREVAAIACERPGIEGLWVAPWCNYVEVVDERGATQPPGVEGEIAVTSLVNYAMPLLRYRIGDRGVMLPERPRGGQALARILGRNVDAFRRRDGTLVDGEYFTHLLYFRDWVQKFQFVQRSFEEVVLKVVPRDADRERVSREILEIEAQARAALGPAAVLRVEWVEEIPPAPSGKYRYTVSEIPPP